ncbi:response regulator [Roseomonas terrae]|jgi:two-component sensor histidine kinase/DNA-binding response OmpR family regulator|uniref:histidine kinase n=1 Tax=Neoroseomonas terrae TaxID=424799 RepID=A0ABS5EPU4_9PROT|nr:response regulator [Neoroseomonas terrae]MBR0653057.1 response regulator [Neoroseomonas terrae]
MWEKIVLNLLSNALKFTFAGSIRVTLTELKGTAILAVSDTGTGIPANELPYLFDRFHRVEGAAGRSHEGSGIGLALVRELIRLHGGDVRVQSEPGRGSVFTIAIPLGTAPLLADELAHASQPATSVSGSTSARTEAYVDEVMRWLPKPSDADATAPSPREISAPSIPANAPRILVADDNSDMRDYLTRLLAAARYRVETAKDGQEALQAALDNPPALVLSDVMMPQLDGFALLRALRADPRTADAPVLLLSARAGEEAEVEGLNAGADDYMVKPFSARELLARVGANLRLAQFRREAADAAAAGEARWRGLLTRMKEGFCICDMEYSPDGEPKDWRYVEVSGGWDRMVGIPAAKVTGRRASELFPGLGPRWLATYAKVLETGEPAHIEDYVQPVGRWFEVSAYRIEPGRFGALFLDVTERRAAEGRQALLAREVDHRAKNMLAVVQSIVRLTAANDIEEYADAVEGRVAALARAHALLAKDRWEGTDLLSVLKEETEPYHGRVALAGPPITLRPEAVQAVAMIVHELATNAAKYGALSVATGGVAVTWHRDAVTGALHMRWLEHGGPSITAAPDRQGFGSILIEQTVFSQLAGKVRWGWHTAGLECDIDVAAANLATATPATPPTSARPDNAPRCDVALRGIRVLVVEDDALVGLEMAARLRKLGCDVVGRATTLDSGLALAHAERARVDVALLDINLRGQFAYPIAWALADAGVPVVWTSGYGELSPDAPRLARTQLLHKPIADAELISALRRAVIEPD